MNKTQSTYLALMGIDRWQLRHPHLLPTQTIAADLSRVRVQPITTPLQPQWLVLAADAQELGVSEASSDALALWHAWWQAVGVTLADLAVGIITTAHDAQPLSTLLQHHTPRYLALMGTTLTHTLLPAAHCSNNIFYEGKIPVILLPSISDMLHDPLQKRIALRTMLTAQQLTSS